MAILCQLIDPEHYNPFDWDTRQSDADRHYWLGLFEGFPAHIEQHLREDGLTGDDFDARWAAFLAEYEQELERIRTESDRTKRQSTLELGLFRQEMLRKFGWPDPYLKVKQRENDLAATQYPAVVTDVDATEGLARWDLLFRGLFAGNMFDLGSPDTIEMYRQGQIDFHAIGDRLPPRPWFIDDGDAIRDRLRSDRRWRQALIFVDNAGTDIVLGVMPVVREMARLGTRIVLAANSEPALNDITITELNAMLARLGGIDPVLFDLIERQSIVTVDSGGDIPLIDLSRVSDACNKAADESDLIVLQGMGRGVESNWRQRFKCDVWRVALLKDRIVTRWVNANLFDPVCRLDAPGVSWR